MELFLHSYYPGAHTAHPNFGIRLWRSTHMFGNPNTLITEVTQLSQRDCTMVGIINLGDPKKAD